MNTESSLRPVTMTLPVEVIKSLDRIAEAEDRSRSSVVRRLIESAFDSGLNASPAGVDVQAGALENKPTPQPDPFYR
jgi:predicted transcriptional regulator